MEGHKTFFKQKSKYKSIKQDGFDSKFEQKVSELLEKQQAKGQISDLNTQERIHFRINDQKIATSIVDFTYTDKHGVKVWYEAKGFVGAEWPMKHRLMIALLPEIEPGSEYWVHWQSGKVEKFV